MKYLFSDWARVSSRIQKSHLTFLFFDYDGTLTPIAATPELARIPASVKSLLKKLKKTPGFKLAIISGRSLADVKSMVGVKGIVYAGNHGLEIEDEGRNILKSGSGTTLKKAKFSLKKALTHIKGARVEDKGCTLSVHFRLVKPSQRMLVKKIFNSITAPYVLSGRFKTSAGKMVLELRPGIEWDKGKAVLYLLKRYKRALPIYTGDDVTDEDAFRVIKKKGMSVFVGTGKKKTGAAYFLKNTRDIKKFIVRMLEL
ncbi:MAG: trehalose-phosphatase [Candidatus Omnitrophica bacterium]|nr:trehalose-phosphatase [Candidatus Omnitrophota bacterium]